MINVKVKRVIRITKKKWLDTIENNIGVVGVCVEVKKNGDEWRFRTRVTDPK
jgi:hypothetical protein